MKKLIASLLIFSQLAFATNETRFKGTTIIHGSQSIGTSSAPDSKAVLDLVSTTKGMLPPRMTQTQRDAISSPPTGLTVYNTTTNTLNVYNGSAWAAAGSGSGGTKNYVTTNPDIEFGATTGFSLGTATLTNGIPTGAPTFGSGASGNLSLAASSSSPIAGNFSLSYVSSAATTAGNFVATDAFTVDPEGQGKPLEFKISYRATTNPSNGNFSGTSSNSFGVAVYDVTNTSWLNCSGTFNVVQSSGVGTAKGNCQTNINTASARLVFYNVSASSGAITMSLDNFSYGPQITAQGAAISDWKSFTMSITGSSSNPTKGATTIDNAQWRQVGDSMEIQYNLITTGSGGAAGSGYYIFNLPSGRTVDTTKTYITSNNSSALGSCTAYNGSTYVLGIMSIAPGTTTGLICTATSDTSAPNQLGSAFYQLSGAVSYGFIAKVPISGWSSNTVMSNDTDTREVSARATNTAGTSIGSGATAVPFATITYDSHSSLAATGIYTVPVSGKYKVTARLTTASVNIATTQSIELSLYKNGSQYSVLAQRFGTGSSQNLFISGNDEVQCNAGDTLQIYINPGASTSLFTVAGFNGVTFERLSGPATIAAPESVNARYTTATGIVFSAGVGKTVDYSTKVYDSHNSVTTGASWVFTAPVSGKYQVDAAVYFTAAWTAGDPINLFLYKNGSIYARIFGYNVPASTTLDVQPHGGTVVQLNAGDTIRVDLNSNKNTTLATDGTLNYISIDRVGN